ncbi:MAG: response regulator [Betaproteobacteria bacterium]|nr:response regulator [Betaproteobacteria bacterium]
MPERHQGIVRESDIFALTPKAQRELQGSGTALSPAELEVLVLIDGNATVGETAERVPSDEKATILEIFGKLFLDGFIETAEDQDGTIDFADFFQSIGPVSPSADAIAKAKKQVAATTLLLKQKGYTVRIARKAGAERDIDKTRMLSVIVVEDEAHLAGMLRHVLTAEGFDVRLAKNREEIVAQFRRPPRPDLILLDVILPDADGFDVLHKIRQHPALKTIPVVMLTAQATREAVLKGLEGGADGYITKPFQIDVLLKAVAAVLGLPNEGLAADESEDPWPP